MKFTCLITALLISYTTLSQDPKLKFGAVTKEDLELSECPFYPEADAMVLAEWGYLRFNYNNEKGFQYQLDVTRRVKIFNTAGKEYGNISISLYEPTTGSYREEVNTIKGFTYNLVNGKVEKTKLKNSEEYKTRLSDYRVEQSFAMPDVREGCVIEYKYTLISDFVSTLKSWHFQNDLPTAISQLNYTIPEFYHYTINQVGSIIPVERENQNRNESFTYKWEVMEPGGEIRRGTSSVESLSKNEIATARNILPIEDEPYMNNRPNIPARLEFQLMSRKMPNGPLKVMAGSYEKFNEDIMTRSSFGQRLNKGNFAKDKIATLNTANDLSKAAAIYTWLRDHFIWDNVYTYYGEKAGRSTFNEGTGNVAEINLTLIAALREAGLNAYPVLVSTRGHGIPHPVYPNYEDFNYVVAAVNIDNNLYLCDATSKKPFGKLPYRCLNGNGWLAAEAGGQWVNLKANANHATTYLTRIKIEGDLLKATVEAKYEDHAATEVKNEIEKSTESEYEANLAEKFPEWSLNKVSKSDTASQLRLAFELEKDFDNEDIIYLQPILYGGITENRFKREKRISPIDFPYALSKQIMVSIEIPDGYVPELPEPIYMKLPENGGRFIYQVSQLGNMLNVLYNINLQKLDFTPAEYPQIKQFYQTIADRSNEMIVLKKL